MKFEAFDILIHQLEIEILSMDESSEKQRLLADLHQMKADILFFKKDLIGSLIEDLKKAKIL